MCPYFFSSALTRSSNRLQFAAPHMSLPGTKRPFVHFRCSVAIQGKADIDLVVVNRRE
jgi:hypothetical protein